MWLLLAAVALGIGAAAQVTREEFDALAKQVKALEGKVTLLEIQVRRLDRPGQQRPAAAQKAAPVGNWSELVTWRGYGRTDTHIYKTGAVGTFNPAAVSGLGVGTPHIPLTGIKRSFTASGPWRIRWETNGTDWLRIKGTDGIRELLLVDAQGVAASVTGVYPNPGGYELEILAPPAQWYSVTVEQQAARAAG